MSTNTFTPGQVESLIRLLEASVEVKRRFQFFLWTQGDLQTLVPHKLAACGAYDPAQRDLAFEVLNSIPLPGEVVATLGSVRSPVMTRLMAEWGRAGCRSTWVALRGLALQDSGAQGLIDSGYEWVLVHGVSRPGRPHDLETFFVFGSPGPEHQPLATQALHLLLPYLHSTYVRVFNTEQEMNSSARPAASGRPAAGPVTTLTGREREILRWVRDGKSNQAISEELGISALTVKNHVQKILRKLGAANRAQAVGKALMMNMFHPH